MIKYIFKKQKQNRRVSQRKKERTKKRKNGKSGFSDLKTKDGCLAYSVNRISKKHL
jgi:hypothetical protein